MSMKSLPPLALPPVVPASEAAVLPRPEPIAEEVEPLEADAAEEDVEDDGAEVLLEPLDVFPNRLVAALNAEEAFGAEVLEGAAEVDVDDVEAADEVVVLEAVEVDDESRPYPLRLPLKFGVMRDT
jgi:hypothetical protein